MIVFNEIFTFFKSLTIKNFVIMKKEMKDKLSPDEKMIIKVQAFCNCFMELLHLNKHVNNNIQSVLELLIKLSNLKGKNEYLAQIYAYTPYIKQIVDEKSEDFSYHSGLLRKYQENMDKHFDEINEEISAEDEEKFNFFIKKQGRLMLKELEMYRELEKVYKTTHI